MTFNEAVDRIVKPDVVGFVLAMVIILDYLNSNKVNLDLLKLVIVLMLTPVLVLLLLPIMLVFSVAVSIKRLQRKNKLTETDA